MGTKEIIFKTRKIAGLGLTLGSLWQIWECIMALMNGWSYAFPFMLIVCKGQTIWLAMDFWIFLIIIAYFIGTL